MKIDWSNANVDNVLHDGSTQDPDDEAVIRSLTTWRSNTDVSAASFEFMKKAAALAGIYTVGIDLNSDVLRHALVQRTVKEIVCTLTNGLETGGSEWRVGAGRLELSWRPPYAGFPGTLTWTFRLRRKPSRRT